MGPSCLTITGGDDDGGDDDDHDDDGDDEPGCRNEVMRLDPAKVTRVDINCLLFSLDFKLTVDSVKSEDQVKKGFCVEFLNPPHSLRRHRGGVSFPFLCHLYVLCKGRFQIIKMEI